MSVLRRWTGSAWEDVALATASNTMTTDGVQTVTAVKAFAAGLEVSYPGQMKIRHRAGSGTSALIEGADLNFANSRFVKITPEDGQPGTYLKLSGPGDIGPSVMTWTGTSLTVNGSYTVLSSNQQRFHRSEHAGGTVATDASGFATVTHGAPFTPSAVFVTSKSPGSSWAVFHGADSFGVTNARFRWFNASTAGVYASASVGAFTALWCE